MKRIFFILFKYKIKDIKESAFKVYIFAKLNQRKEIQI